MADKYKYKKCGTELKVIIHHLDNRAYAYCECCKMASRDINLIGIKKLTY